MRRFLLTLSILLPAASAETQQRDVVLILTDDQNYHEQPFMPLTNLLIGDQGVRFELGFAHTSLCCPSRATILTGLYKHRHGVQGNRGPNGGVTAFHDSSTIATWLTDAGYVTGLFGKYLNAYEDIVPYVPPGWTRWWAEANGRFVNEDGTVTPAVQHKTPAITAKAVEFIRAVPSGKRLLAYVSYKTPHYPAHPLPQDQGAFAFEPPYRPPSYDESDVSDKPRWVSQLQPLTVEEQDSTDAFYRRKLEALQAVDRGVRDIVRALTDAGRLEDTVIIFTSDHGLAMGEHRYTMRKNCPYEECIRVPLLVRMPGVAPRVDDTHLVSLVDLAPTIAELAGVTPPGLVNGRSLTSILADPDAPWRGASLHESGAGQQRHSALRTRRWKYVEYDNGDVELYDLESDPWELENAVNVFADTIPILKAALAEMEKE